MMDPNILAGKNKTGESDFLYFTHWHIVGRKGLLCFLLWTERTGTSL